MVIGVGAMVGTCPAHILQACLCEHSELPCWRERYRQVLSTGKLIRKTNTDMLTSIDLITSTTMLGKVGPLGDHWGIRDDEHILFCSLRTISITLEINNFHYINCSIHIQTVSHVN
jgi:hypothetical protein